MLVISISNYIFSKFIGRKFDFYFSISFIIIFTLIAGSSASVIRASIMAITNIILNLLLKKPNSVLNLSLSIFLILLYNPIGIENVGLILSVFGTIGIIFLSKTISEILNSFIRIKIIKETLAVTLSAQIILIPVLAYYFNNVSLLAIFSNLLIVPVTESLTLIGFVIFLISLFSLSLARTIAYIPTILIKYVIKMSSFCANFELLNLEIPTPKWWMIVFYYIIICVEFKRFFYKQNNHIFGMTYDFEIKKINYIRKLVYLLLVSIVILSFFVLKIPKNYTELTAIDVGQGDSFLIKTSKGKNILIDGGGSENGEYDVGEKVLVPYFLDRWILNIDTVFISHAHADHIEGIYSVIEKLNVKKVVVGASTSNNEYMNKLEKLCNYKNVKIIKVQTGDSIKIDGINFEILHPRLNEKESNENNLSLLMRVTINDIKILFTGDMEKDIEEQINFDVSADILKVSHHGSKTSTTAKFLESVGPRISIVSVSENNLYGHPDSEVINRLKMCSKVFITKDSGEINFFIYKNGKIKVKTHIR